MNLKNIYEQYKSINPDLTEEMFNKTYQDFGDEYLTMIDEELKKKDPPNGEEELTPIQGSMATEPTFQQIEMPLPTIPNTNAPNLSVLDTTESPISTASASEIGVSSLEGDYNNLSQHRPVINPDLSISQASPVSNPLDAYRPNVDVKVEVPNIPPIVTENQSNVIRGKKQSALSSKKKPKFIFEDVEDEMPPKAEQEEDLLNFNQERYIKEGYMKKDYLYPFQELVPAEFNKPYYSSGIMSDVTNMNKGLLDLENQGVLKIERDENNTPILDDKGGYGFTITDEKYYNEKYLPYVANLNTERRKKWEEENIRIARERGEKAKEFKTEVSITQSEIFDKLGKTILLDNDEFYSAESLEDLYSVYARKEAEDLVKNNSSINYDTEYRRIYNLLSGDSNKEKYEEAGRRMIEQYADGIHREIINDIAQTQSRAGGAIYSEEDIKHLKENTHKEEQAYIQKVMNDPELLQELGKHWFEKGQYTIGRSRINLRKQFDNYTSRAEYRNIIENFKDRKVSADKELVGGKIRQLQLEIKNGHNPEDNERKIQEIQRLSSKYNSYEEKHNSVKSKFSEWKNSQKEYLKDEKRLQELEAGYQNGEIGAGVIMIGANIANKVVDAVKSPVAGVGRIANFIVNSNEFGDTISHFSKDTKILGIGSKGIQERYSTYTLGGKTIEEREGRFYEVDKNGKYTPITLTDENKDKLKFVKTEKEFSVAGTLGTVAGTGVEMAIANFTGMGAGRLLNIVGNTKALRTATTILGEESAMVQSMRGLTKLVNKPSNYGVSGWYLQTLDRNAKEGIDKGLSGAGLFLYANIQSTLTGLLSKVNPDAKFFNFTKTFQEKLAYNILNGNKQGILSLVKEFGKTMKSSGVSLGKEVAEENIQEHIELVAENLVKQVSNVYMDRGNRFDGLTLDEFIDTAIQTTITVGGLKGINTVINGREPQLHEYEGKLYDLSTMPRSQKVAMLSLMNTDGFFHEMKTQWLTNNKAVDKLEAEVSTARKYIDKIPNKEDYSFDTLAKSAVYLQQIDRKKKDLSTADDVFKPVIQEQIETLETELRNTLKKDKEQEVEPMKENNTVDNNRPESPINSQEDKEISQPQNGNVINNEEEQGQNDLSSPVADVEQPTSTNPQEGADVIEYNGKLYTIQGNDVKDQNGNSVPKKDQATILEQGKIVSNQQQGEQENISEQNIPKQKNEEEEDIDIDFSNSLYINARIQGNNPPNDGATELGSESLPNTERGQDNPQGVSQTANLGGSETKAEITPNKKELLWESEPSKETTTASPNSHTVLQGSESNVSDANSSNSQDGDTKILPINQNTNIERKPLSEIHTDESRFQGRKKLNETIVNNIANNFSDKDQDPIHIWTDPKDDKTYVLSGHHRYYGAKRAGREDVKVIDRSADFTEEQAIRFAKEEANANRSMETPLERANTLRQKRERGEDTKAFLENEGRNKNLVHNLSYLNPKGKAVQSMSQFDSANESDSKRETERIADWTGEVMRVFKDYLTPAHENEIYDYLNNKEKSKRFTNKREFVEKVRSLIGLDFDAKQPLNLSRVSSKGSQEQEWENEAKRLRDEIADYEKQITDLDNRFTDPKREDYISPDTKDFQELKEIAREQKTKLKSEQELVYKELDAHNRAKGNYLKADASMGNLFGDVDFNKTPYKKGKITYRAFDKLVEKLQKHFGKAFKKGVNITTDWNEFQKKAEAYRNGKKQKRENEAFNRELNALKAKGKDYPKHFLSLGLPSNILKSIGIPNLNITIGKNTLLNSSQKNNGRYDLSDLKNLPEAINNPLIVFENPSEAHPNRRGLLINLTNGKRNFLAVIQVNDSKDGVDLNNVVSIHPRNFNNFVNWINDKNLLYVDKENASKWLSSPLVETEKQSHSDNAQTTRLIDAKLQNNIDKAIEKVENFENPPIKNDVEYHIGAKARLTYEQQILKNNPNISEEHLQESLDFLHSLEDSKENTKAIKIAVKWLANDTIRLPFAMDNVRKAIALADKHKIDPMKFKSPMDIINKYYVDVEYGKAVNPDNIPEFTNRRVVEYDGDEVVIYDVEDSEAGQIAVVKVAHQHFGWSNESGNSKQPWCLAGFTRTGKPTESARNYWHNTYNSVGKKIAFQNGKPIAFMAHDKNYEGDLWWDLEDQPSNNLPLPNGTYLDPDGEISEKKGGDTDEDLDDYYEDAVQIVADDLADYEFRDIVQWLYEKTAYEERSDFQTSRIWEDTQSDIQDKAKELLEDEIRYKMDDGEYDDLLEEKINEYKEENGYNEDEELEGYELDEIKDDLRQEILDNYYDYYGLEEIFYEKEAEVKEDELYNYNYTSYQMRMILEDYTRYNYDDSFDLRDSINAEQERLWSENGGGYTDIHFMKTPSGVIYGAKLPDGSLYINPEHLNANTPIHEFGHIWEQLMPQRFAKGVELLKNTKAGKELFRELRKNKGYENYSDDRLWNEALVTMLGNRGEELYHSNSASKFVAWVKDFFKALGEYLHKMSGGKIGKELTPDDKMQTFIKGALAEIMGAKEIIPESNVTKKEVPIYLKDMTNAEIRTMLENMNLVVPAKCA